VEIILTILVFLLILLVLVLAHEFGHFATAKLAGVKVEEFGVGFPPRLWSFKRGETIYSLNAIPLGGFTKMVGEEDPSHPRSLAAQKRPTRILILCAGSIMNLLLPFLLFTIALMVPHEVPTGPVVITEVLPDTPAASAGLAVGDQFISIDGKPVQNSIDISRNVALKLGQEITLVMKSTDNTTRTVKLIPRWQQGAMGVKLEMTEVNWVKESEPFWQAIPDGFTTSIETLVLYKNEILKWIIGAAAPAVVGPVGIAQMTGEVIQGGLSPLLQFAAFLSLSLGIVNLFPLPALDGGRIAFVVLEWIRRGKRISPKKEGLVHLIGFLLLIAVILLVTYHDIVRIVSGGSLTP